jgi:hypothetical protein
MDNKSWIKVYLDDAMTQKVCRLGGGDSYECLNAGIHTALNIAVARILPSPMDQQHVSNQRVR